MLYLLVGKFWFYSWVKEEQEVLHSVFYFWFIPGSPEILSMETEDTVCQITAISPLQEQGSVDHSPGCSHTIQNTSTPGRHMHRVKGWSRRVITISWMPWSSHHLPAEMKEEDSPSLVKKWRACTYNEEGRDCRAGCFLQSSPFPVAYDYSKKFN